MQDKDYWKILDSVLRLEVVKGHLRWKVSDISRVTGVKRPTIYYYFGKSKEGILNEALKIIGNEFCGLTPERLELWQKGEIRESILRTRELIRQAPHLVEFFFHWRHKESALRDEFIRLQKRYIAKLNWHLPHLNREDLEAVYAVVFGLLLIPDLPEPVLNRVLERLPFSGTTPLTKT